MLKLLGGARAFRSGQDPVQSALGRLERDVMDVIWQGGDFAVRDVQARLSRPTAYTTVMTTLDRLFKKGYVARRREGRAFVYSALHTRDELTANLTTGLLTSLLAERDGAVPVLSNLVDVVARTDDGLLDELERLVRDKRQLMRACRKKE